MVEMSRERWAYTGGYLREVFGAVDDPVLAALPQRATEAGLPPISISAEVGRLLSILVRATAARTAIELGTLGGHSALWIARAMPPGSRLYTVELDPAHADFAEAQLAAAGVDDRVEVLRGPAQERLPQLAAALGEGSVDFAFVDADKERYLEYARLLVPMLRPGGLLVVDNVLGTSRWWIDDEDHPTRAAVDAMNRWVAAHPALEATAVPLREGLLIAEKRASR